MANDDRRVRSMSDEETKKVMKVGAVLAVSALIFMIGLVILVHNDLLQMHPKSTKAETLRGFGAKYEYAFRYQTLLIFWLLFNVFATIYVRISTLAVDPLDDKSEVRAQPMKNILTNSMETIVISIFSQLIFVSYAEPITILKYIPLINVVQFIGRVAFLVGYPLKRAFGFQCSILPNLVLNIYNLYKFGSFMELY